MFILLHDWQHSYQKLTKSPLEKLYASLKKKYTNTVGGVGDKYQLWPQLAELGYKSHHGTSQSIYLVKIELVHMP